MPTITTRDGVDISTRTGEGQPIVFSHGWPLSADDWDTQMLFFLHHGYRVIAHDRRGHGRRPDRQRQRHGPLRRRPRGADRTLDSGRNPVGHSTGGGEVARYVARHGESRVAKAASSARCRR